MSIDGQAVRFVRSTEAVAAIEFAIIAPVVIVLMGMLLEFGFYFQAYDATNKLATQYAISYSDCDDYPAGTCLTEAGYYTTTSAIRNLAPRLNSANVTVRVFQIVAASSTSFTVTYSSPSGATLTSSERNYLSSKVVADDVAVLVSVSYTHTLTFGTIASQFLGSRLTIPATVVQIK